MTPDELRAWLTRHKLSRHQAGDALGISKRTIDAYLRKSDPRPITGRTVLAARYYDDVATIKPSES
jgi:transcriptional regulator with XRE-family HTH domain